MPGAFSLASFSCRLRKFVSIHADDLFAQVGRILIDRYPIDMHLYFGVNHRRRTSGVREERRGTF